MDHHQQQEDVGSCELAHTLGITQKSAWFMLHRIRLAMQKGSLLKVGSNWGEVAADQTFIQDGIIPVELKKSARPPARGGVYPNHLIQVLAYIVLVRESYNEPVPYGLVLYGKEEARKVYPTAENMAWLE